MALLDIGTLVGNIIISEQIAATASRVNNHLESIGVKFEGITKGLVLGSAAIIGALGGVAAGIVTLGEKGSTILGVEEAFNRLATSIGETGEALIGGLSAGVKDTVDSFVLMQSANRALSAGVKLTASDMRTLGATAREMAKAAGTDAASELNKLFSAMTTGRVRSLQLAGVMVNVRDAQADFAKSLGVTADKLSEEGRLHAVRIAILEASRNKLNQLGESQLSLKERIDQAQVAFGNWVDNLSKAIAKSPAVHKAFEDISKAIGEAFGDKGQGLIDILMQGVDAFARGVSFASQAIVPLKNAIDNIISTVKSFWQWLVDLNNQFKITDTVVHVARASFNFLRQAFDLVQDAAQAVINAWKQMPTWLQEISKTAVLAGLGLGAVGAAAALSISPMASLVGSIDQAINIFGNFTGGLHATNLLLAGQWKAITNSTTVIGGYLIATNSMTVATNFWSAALARAQALTISLAESTGLLTVAQRVATGATAFLTASKNALAGALSFVVKETMATLSLLGLETAAQRGAATATGLLTAAKGLLLSMTTAVSGAMTAFAARLGITTLGLNAARIAAGATTVAMGFLGTALLALTSIPALATITLLVASLGELGKAFTDTWARWKAGKEMGFFEFLTQKDEDNWVRRMLGIGQAARDLRDKVTQDLQSAAEQQKKWIQDITGVTQAAEVAKLQANWNALTREQQLNIDVMKRVGEQALELRERGIPLLSYELNVLADRAANARPKLKDLGDTARFLKTGGIDPATQAIKNLADELSGAKLLGSVRELNQAWASLTDEQRRSPEVIDRMLVRIKALVAQGGLPSLSKEAHQLWVSHLAIKDMLPQVTSGFQGILNIGPQVTLVYKEQTQTLKEMLEVNEKLRNFRPIITTNPMDILKTITGGLKDLGKPPGLFTSLFLSLKEQFGKFVDDLGPTILSALTGGGDVGRAIGGLAGQHLGKSLTAAFGGFLTKHLGQTLGGAIGSILPGIGTLLGAGLGALFDKIPWKTLGRNISRDMQDAFATTELGFENLNALSDRLRRMGSAGVNLATRGNTAQRRDDEEATQKWMEDVRKFLGDLDADIQRYNLSWANMVDPLERLKKGIEGANALMTSFERLRGAGFSVESITKGMAGDINAWLSAAIKAGTGIPPEIGKIIKQLVTSKQLTEENARALLGMAEEGVPSLQEITEAAERYGLKLDDLGPKVQQIRITEAAEQIVKDFNLLTAAGVPFETLMTNLITHITDTGEVFEEMSEDAQKAYLDAGGKLTEVTQGMQKDIQDLVTKSLTMGLVLPASMKPIIDKLIEAGGLTDEFGDKLIDSSRLNFETPIIDKIDDLIEAINNLILKFQEISPAVETEVKKSLSFWDKLRAAMGQPIPTPSFPGTGGGGAPTVPQPGPAPTPGPAPIPDPGFTSPRVGPESTTIQIIAWDGRSVEQWLEQGGAAQITRHVAVNLPNEVEFYRQYP